MDNLIGRLRRAKDDRGFTAVELLVAITVAGMVIGFGSQIFRFYYKNFLVWEERIQTEESTRRVIGAMARDLTMMRRLLQFDHEMVAFLDAQRRQIVYDRRDQFLRRNQYSLLPAGLRVAELSFSYLGEKGQKIHPGEHGRKIGMIQIHLAVQGPGPPKFELISAVKLRNLRRF